MSFSVLPASMRSEVSRWTWSLKVFDKAVERLGLSHGQSFGPHSRFLLRQKVQADEGLLKSHYNEPLEGDQLVCTLDLLPP